MKRLNLLLTVGGGSLLALASCAPTVNIGTPEPVKIDVSMRADIYTHDEKDKPKAAANDESLTPAQRRFNRRGEIQDLKNNRVAGEGNDGLLRIREEPKDEKYAEYAKKTVAEENADRNKEFKTRAEELKKPLDVYIKDFAQKANKAAYPGEWVQEEDGSWKKR
jgi:uncharacterized protein YdbL (DUF1318 family)